MQRLLTIRELCNECLRACLDFAMIWTHLKTVNLRGWMMQSVGISMRLQGRVVCKLVQLPDYSCLSGLEGELTGLYQYWLGI